MFVGICFVFGALSLQLANGAPQNKNSDSSIVFPGPVQDVSRRYANNTNLPDKCKNQNYCTVKPDDYPQELFNQMFKGKYKEPIFQPTYVMTDDRQGDPEDMDDCESKVEFEQLFKVKSQAGEWFTVVQAPDEHFLQMVRIETCLDLEQSTSRMMTRRATAARDMEDKLRATLKELESSKTLCRQLLQERDDSEVEVKESGRFVLQRI